MLEQASILIFIVIALALIFDFVNGFHDTANAIATCVSTRAVSPAVAIIMSAILNFAGAMISTGVAKTIGGDIVQSASMVNEVIIIAALAGAIIWNLITWWFGMPSSSSHALVGGIIGAVIISVGFYGIKWLWYFKNIFIFSTFSSCCHGNWLDYTTYYFCYLSFHETSYCQ